MAAEAKFDKNDIVVVRDGSLFYESKILRAECFSDSWKYFVHYQGWNRKWDCWVDSDLVFKKDKDGLEKLRLSKLNIKKIRKCPEPEKAVSLSDREAGNKKKRCTEEPLGMRRRKKQLQQSDMSDDTDHAASTLKIQIPLTLKKHLVDEWKIVTQKPHCLITLPRPFTVRTIINEFLQSKFSKLVDAKMTEKYSELFKGLVTLFDKALPLVLLYRHEREQYVSHIKQATNLLSPSDVYGSEHLLRLFVRIPELSSSATLASSDVQFVKQKLVEFLRFVQKNSARYLNALDYQKISDDT